MQHHQGGDRGWCDLDVLEKKIVITLFVHVNLLFFIAIAIILCILHNNNKSDPTLYQVMRSDIYDHYLICIIHTIIGGIYSQIELHMCYIGTCT